MSARPSPNECGRPNVQAFSKVCSLITISVLSALGLDTLAAIAAPSVSSMTLDVLSAMVTHGSLYLSRSACRALQPLLGSPGPVRLVESSSSSQRHDVERSTAYPIESNPLKHDPVQSINAISPLSGILHMPYRSKEMKLTHHQSFHPQLTTPNPNLPTHSSSQSVLSITEIPHHGKRTVQMRALVRWRWIRVRRV
jgi:hypothetical protein